MRINLKHGISIFVVLSFVLLALGSGTTDSAVRTNLSAKEVVYTEIQYSELASAISSVNESGHGFVVEAYFINTDAPGEGSYRISDTQNGTPSRWFDAHYGGNTDTTNYTYFEPHQFETYNEQTYRRIDKNKKYKIYIGVYQKSPYMNSWDPFIDKIEGLMSMEEAAVFEVQQKAEKKAAEAKAKEERQKALDDKAKPLAKGYTYHGAAEDSQSSKLFNSGALEAGHAYYISGFMVGGGGLTGGVIISFFADPTYHIVEYASQKVKGEVVGASQTIFGTLPVTVVIAGGRPPLRTPVILGLLE